MNDRYLKFFKFEISGQEEEEEEKLRSQFYVTPPFSPGQFVYKMTKNKQDLRFFSFA